MLSVGTSDVGRLPIPMVLFLLLLPLLPVLIMKLSWIFWSPLILCPILLLVSLVFPGSALAQSQSQYSQSYQEEDVYEDDRSGSYEQQQQQQQREQKEQKNHNDAIDYEIWDVMDASVKLFGQGKTWYDVFAVEESSTAKEISRTYRKLSLQFHPDKNPSAEAAQSFQTLGLMAKILRDPASRRRYDHWLANGIPYWRGRGYYFRKSENLTIAQSCLVILAGFSVMQYVAQMVGYWQVRSGLRLLAERRGGFPVSNGGGVNGGGAGAGGSTTPPAVMSKAAAKQLAKKNRKSGGGSNGGSGRSTPDLSSSGRQSSSVVLSIFDDANVKKALDYMYYQRQITPDLVVDGRAWYRLVHAEFHGQEDEAIQLRFPRPWNTMLFALPWALVKWCLHNKKKKEEDKLQQEDDTTNNNNSNTGENRKKRK